MTAIARPMHYPVFSRYESIAFARYRVDKAGMVRIIAQGLADFADGGVDAVVGVDEDVFAPEAVDDCLARDHGTLAFGEQEKKFERNAFEFQSVAVTPQFEAFAVKLEFTEMVGTVAHCRPPCESPSRAKNYSIASRR